ncbi:hypothetical protein [Burkholderia pyrrocinia]|uniref:hypothetical protein n=1 Tax=Burkholderia pyrrocinia TaxID=60550 RepID=UPI001BD1A5E5|nr:hypothetical protein [Burkholderia pyrrocinia]QVN18270.1 hypothetical protein JYG32_00565 [Burkholderia pyrrocinia]
MIAYLEQADALKYAAPLRRLAIKIDKEIMRAGRMGDPRAPIAPFSDEWRAREAMKCVGSTTSPANQIPAPTRRPSCLNSSA